MFIFKAVHTRRHFFLPGAVFFLIAPRFLARSDKSPMPRKKKDQPPLTNALLDVVSFSAYRGKGKPVHRYFMEEAEQGARATVGWR